MPKAPTTKLTQRQNEILSFISSYQRVNGFAPSIRDIGVHFKISSPNGVMCHLRSLVKKGKLRRPRLNGRAVIRGFEVVGDVKPLPPAVSQIVSAVAGSFRCFGQGTSPVVPGNPIALALKDKPPQFAAGVDVEQVVRFVIERAR